MFSLCFPATLSYSHPCLLVTYIACLPVTAVLSQIMQVLNFAVETPSVLLLIKSIVKTIPTLVPHFGLFLAIYYGFSGDSRNNDHTCVPEPSTFMAAPAYIMTSTQRSPHCCLSCPLNPGSFPSQVWLSLSSVASAWSILTQAAPAIGGKAIKTPLGGILQPLLSLQPQALHGLIQHMVAIRTITT